VTEQCLMEWDGLRCQLRADHDSAHAARADGALITWLNRNGSCSLDLDWFDPLG